MKLSRSTITHLNAVIDDWVPPKLRDSRLAAWAARRMYGELPIEIDELKERAFSLPRDEYADFYRALNSRVDLGESDLTPESFDAVVAAVTGERVLRKQQPVLGGYDPDDYVTERLWATAEDGTEVWRFAIGDAIGSSPAVADGGEEGTGAGLTLTNLSTCAPAVDRWRTALAPGGLRWDGGRDRVTHPGLKSPVSR